MNQQNHPKPQPSDSEVERALAETLHLTGMAFPENADEVEAFEDDVDIQSVSTPDVEKLRRQLAGEPSTPIAAAGSVTSFHVREHPENFAMAARNGSKISDEVRHLMNSDRAQHEKSKRRS